MNIRFTALAVAAAALAVAAGSASADPGAPAAPIHNGCLPGYHLLSVSTDVPQSQNYFLPTALDSPTTGTYDVTIMGSGTALDGVGIPFVDSYVGNGDGYVCGKRLSAETTRQDCPPAAFGGEGCIVPVFYDFTEDDQPDISNGGRSAGE